jgi:hypothetical protein
VDSNTLTEAGDWYDSTIVSYDEVAGLRDRLDHPKPNV